MMWKIDERAQILSSELIMSAFLFSLIIILAFVSWDTTIKSILRSETLHEMDSLSTNAVEKLARTSGFPGDWASLPVDNVSSMGLSGESRVLDQGKVLRFVDLMVDEMCTNISNNPCYNVSDSSTYNITKYECNRHFLGMGRYDFYFTITDLDENVVVLESLNCSAGRSPVDADYMVNVKRSAILNEGVVKISFIGWM